MQHRCQRTPGQSHPAQRMASRTMRSSPSLSTRIWRVRCSRHARSTTSSIPWTRVRNRRDSAQSASTNPSNSPKQWQGAGPENHVAGVAGGDAPDEDVELLTGGHRLRQVEGEQASEVVSGASRDGDVADASVDLAADGVRFRGRQRVRGIQGVGELDHLRRGDLRPVDRGNASGGHAASVDHELVGRLVGGRVTRPYVERLRDPVRVGGPGVVRQGDLQVALGQLV
jgi:hypothetical protein